MGYYWEVSRKGKVLFTIGKPDVEHSPEEVAEMIAKSNAQAAEWDRQRAAGLPSSKKGRDIYYSGFGIWETPFVLWRLFLEWFNGYEVWYSETGLRYVKYTVKGK